MRRILIVEDSQDKARVLTAAIRQLAGCRNAEINRASNTIEALRQLKASQFDVMILDLVIPLRDESSPNPQNAINLLTEVKDLMGVKKPLVIIGTTEYDTEFEKWQATFEDELWYLLLTSGSDAGWIEKLATRLSYLFASIDKWQAASLYESRADVCLITTVARETKHLRAAFAPLQVLPNRVDCVEYYESTLSINSDDTTTDLQIICVETGIKGMAAAAALATKVIYEFRPKWIVMCGIAAGIAKESDFGDIIIPTKVVDYVSGKIKASALGTIFQPDTSVYSMEEKWMGHFNAYVTSKTLFSEILQDWTGQTPKSSPKVVIGPIATGAVVMQDKAEVEKLLGRNRDLIAIDMEAYGLVLATKRVAGPIPEVFCFKCVSDFADPDKTDTWQDYASFISARFTKKFIVEHFKRV